LPDFLPCEFSPYREFSTNIQPRDHFQRAFQGRSTDADAPTFEAKTPGLSSAALASMLQTSNIAITGFLKLAVYIGFG
jgi:hypothetical protein